MGTAGTGADAGSARVDQYWDDQVRQIAQPGLPIVVWSLWTSEIS